MHQRGNVEILMESGAKLQIFPCLQLTDRLVWSKRTNARLLLAVGYHSSCVVVVDTSYAWLCGAVSARTVVMRVAGIPVVMST